MDISKLPNNGAKSCVSRPSHPSYEDKNCGRRQWYMFPKRIVYVLLRFHQVFHLPQGFETFLLLYSRANFTQLIQSCLLRVVNLHERTFTVGIHIKTSERETALIVPQANSRPVGCLADIKSGHYSGIARRSESK